MKGHANLFYSMVLSTQESLDKILTSITFHLIFSIIKVGVYPLQNNDVLTIGSKGLEVQPIVIWM